MKTFVISLLVLFVVIGCSKTPEPESQNKEPAIKIDVEPLNLEIGDLGVEDENKDIEDNKIYTKSYIRGYKDGYSGNWLAPAQWIVAVEYRAGWDAGNRDMLAGKPNKFD